jgi:hypothetical protein
MGSSVDIYVENFLINLNVNKDNYIFALPSTFQKPTLFLKCKVNDIQTNVNMNNMKHLNESKIKKYISKCTRNVYSTNMHISLFIHK